MACLRAILQNVARISKQTTKFIVRAAHGAIYCIVFTCQIKCKMEIVFSEFNSSAYRQLCQIFLLTVFFQNELKINKYKSHLTCPLYCVSQLASLYCESQLAPSTVCHNLPPVLCVTTCPSVL